MERPDTLWEETRQRLLMGDDLSEIAKTRGFPKLRFRAWVLEDAERADQYFRLRADGLIEEAIEVAHTPQEGDVVTDKGDGTVEVKRGDMLGHRKLIVDTNLKIASKWDRERYGDQVNHNVVVGTLSETLRLISEKKNAQRRARLIEADVTVIPNQQGEAHDNHNDLRQGQEIPGGTDANERAHAHEGQNADEKNAAQVVTQVATHGLI